MLTRVGTTDSLVRLADLVTIRRGYISPKVKPIYFNGRPAVVLSVIMQPDQDVTQLGQKLRAAARDYEERLPIGYAIGFSTYQADRSALRSTPRFRTWRRPLSSLPSSSLSSWRASRIDCGDDRSVRRHVFADRHACARHRAGAGLDRRHHHRAWPVGRQRRGDGRGYRQPDRRGMPARTRALPPASSTRFRC
jgi:Cation/multidrug efflux pump